MGYKVIIDKSFLQAEGRDCKRLHFLADAGCDFVLTDTLVYELCSGSRPNEWTVAQSKLFPFAERIEAWKHVGEILGEKIERQQPVTSPIDEEATERLRSWFRRGTTYVPTNLKSILEKSHKEREQDSVESLLEWCRTFAEFEALKKYGAEVQKRVSIGRDVRTLIGGFVTDERLIRWLIAKNQGIKEKSDIYIDGAEDGLSKGWLTYRSAQTRLALLGIWIMKGWCFEEPNKEFRNTKLDMDYVDLLSFGDMLVTNETRGALADMVRWIYGDSKLVLSSSGIDGLIPMESGIQTRAYFEWERDGRPFGDDQAYWFRAERNLRGEALRSVLPHLAS